MSGATQLVPGMAAARMGVAPLRRSLALALPGTLAAIGTEGQLGSRLCHRPHMMPLSPLQQPA